MGQEIDELSDRRNKNFIRMREHEILKVTKCIRASTFMEALINIIKNSKATSEENISLVRCIFIYSERFDSIVQQSSAAVDKIVDL